uniref:HTH iclR-type domain-containing protein n=1 Tax=Elaeophora elaphi TaxID=1147741 RepID=A0A0R3S0M8_9BILA
VKCFLLFSENRKLGENVRCLREQGLTFSQISQQLKQPLSTCYSAMRLLKLSKDYTESLKMVVKRRKRDYTGSLQSGGSCCSSSESDQLVDESPLQTSSSFTLPPSTYANYGLTSTTNQLLHVVNKSIEAAPWHQQFSSNMVSRNSNMKNEGESEERRMTTDHSATTFRVATASFTDTETIPSFVPYREMNPETGCFLEEAKRIASPARIKGNDGTKVTVLEENAENAITQKLTWALEQLENSKKPDEIVQLMNVVASALNILNSLKIKDNFTS